jgi:hypothetical protein
MKRMNLIIYNYYVIKMLTCAYSRLLSPFLEHEVFAWCSETPCFFSRRCTVICSYYLPPDVYYVQSVHYTIFGLSLSLSAHLT